MEKSALKATVHGIVQGVGFRYFTLQKARSLQLTGYVKNLPDGTVEVYAEGEEENLQQLLRHLNRGPLGASVDEVEVDRKTAPNRYQEFSIAH